MFKCDTAIKVVASLTSSLKSRQARFCANKNRSFGEACFVFLSLGELIVKQR